MSFIFFALLSHLKSLLCITSNIIIYLLSNDNNQVHINTEGYVGICIVGITGTI